jgi:nicotinamide mononucleotide transporter
MGPIDIIAALLTLVNVWLVVRRSLWNYPFGLAAVSLSALVFWRERLLSDVLLQGFFFLVQLYGWWVWVRHRAVDGGVAVRWLSVRQRMAGTAVIAALTLGWGALMRQFTDAALPWWDAANLMMSVGAQILMSRRYGENWALWVLVDVNATALYAAKGLVAFTTLYAVLTAMAAWGLVGWRRAGQGVAA